MMKTHLLVNDNGLTSCGRNAFVEGLANTRNVDECNCKNCLKFNVIGISRFDKGSRCGRMFKFGDSRNEVSNRDDKDNIVIW